MKTEQQIINEINRLEKFINLRKDLLKTDVLDKMGKDLHRCEILEFTNVIRILKWVLKD